MLRALVALSIALVGCSTGVPPTTTTTPTAALVSARPSASSSPGAAICANARAAGIGLPPVVQQYLAAWNERDATFRLQLLDQIWPEDAIYIESPGLADEPVVGRAAMSALIARNQGAPGEWFEPRAWHEGYVHHDLLVMPWRHCTPAGPSGVIGTDYAELDPDGRIVRAVGFTPLPPDRSGVGDSPAAACTGTDNVEWSAVAPIVERYMAAWNAPASTEREEILNAMADEETQVAASWDPSTPHGPAQITAFIDHWKTPGNHVEPSAWGDGDHHDGWFHVRWRDCAATGGGFVEGIEILHVESDGMLERAVSFASW